MPITAANPFKGRHFPGEVIVLCVRWYLRYPLAYEHVAELLAERGVEVASGVGCRLMLPS
jgi:transposase-like protein